MNKNGETRYFDERDTLFARTRLLSGTPAFQDYYHRFPERLAIDDKLRRDGGLMRLASGGRLSARQIQESMPTAPNLLTRVLMRMLPPYRARVEQRMKAHVDRMLEEMSDEDRISAFIDDSTPTIRALHDANRVIRPAARKAVLQAERATSLVKEVARFYGAALVGIAEMEDFSYYTHRANGEPIPHDFKYAIVFAVVMPKEMVNRAPHRETLLATCNGYVDAALTGARLSGYIKSLGYETSLNCMVSYDAPLVLLGERAGIGQVSRSNVLVTKEYGNRIRLGAVLTNLPLTPDQPEDFGLKDFCMLCGKCAVNCPTRALTSDPPQMINGSLVWDHHEVRCFEMWMRFATDCALCIASCPFTQGVDPEKVAAMKGNRPAMAAVLDEDRERHGFRARASESLPIGQV